MKATYRGACLLAVIATNAASVANAAAPQGSDAQVTPSTPGLSILKPASGQLEEVVVTAQRRSQSLQKVAVPVDVIQGRALKRGAITSATQLTSLLPSVQIGSSGPAPSIFLRGVGAYSSTAGQSPAVPFYVDGTYVGRSESLPSEFYDVDRIELLKGPQGTLYGRNASGGAFNILTTRPVLNTTSGNASVEFGNFGEKVFEGGVTVPLSQTLALRASTQLVSRDGYTSEGFGDDKHQSGRLKLLWQPNADLSVLIDGSISHVGGKGAANVLLNDNVKGWYPWLDVTDPRVKPLYDGAPLNAQFGPGTVQQPQPSAGFQNLRFYNMSTEIRWNTGPVIVTLQPSFRRASMAYSEDAPFQNLFGPGFGNQPGRPETSNQESVELRAENANPGPLKYVAGLYFYNEDQYQQFTVNGGPVEHVEVVASYGTRSYAAFGQATYSVTSDFRVTGGVRLTSDERTIGDGNFYDLQPSLLAPTSPCFVPLVLQAAPQCDIDRYAGDETFRNVSWKGGIELDVLNNDLLYANVSKGFKAGGFNTQSTPQDPGSGTVIGSAQSFQPETLLAYEAGFKGRFLQNRLQLNLEGYYWDYNNHQEPRLTATPSGAFNLDYFNAGKAQVYGFDITTIARPWLGATLHGSVEYAESEYVDFVTKTLTAFTDPSQTGCRTSLDAASHGAFTLTNCSGFPIARTPKWTGSAGIDQSFKVGEGNIIAAADVTFASSRYLSTEFVPVEKAPFYALLNASLTYNPTPRWSLTGFVRNINDGRSYTFNFVNNFAGVYAAHIGEPRTYGARLSVNF